HRQSDIQNWRTVEVVLEGAVFLVMGLQLKHIVDDVFQSHETIWHALWPAAAALGILMAIRLAFVTPLVAYLDRHLKRMIAWEPTLSAMKDDIDSSHRAPDTAARRYLTRIDRRLADIDYYRTEAIGPREGLVVVWAGMRGVVTLAAAQTLPADTPYRSLLILVAFFVATLSLLIQGGTVAAFVKFLRLPDNSAEVRDERHRLRREMSEIAAGMMRDPAVIGYDPGVARRVTLLRELERNDADEHSDALDQRLAMARKLRQVRRKIIVEQRRKLVELRDAGTYSSEALTQELARLDTEEISLNTGGIAN
ncbi:MAG: cation:proton antiporter, partial [Gordonia sp. (in: high G+C Gram-positive bacteria)]